METVQSNVFSAFVLFHLVFEKYEAFNQAPMNTARVSQLCLVCQQRRLCGKQIGLCPYVCLKPQCPSVPIILSEGFLFQGVWLSKKKKKKKQRENRTSQAVTKIARGLQGLFHQIGSLCEQNSSHIAVSPSASLSWIEFFNMVTFCLSFLQLAH